LSFFLPGHRPLQTNEYATHSLSNPAHHLPSQVTTYKTMTLRLLLYSGYLLLRSPSTLVTLLIRLPSSQVIFSFAFFSGCLLLRLPSTQVTFYSGYLHLRLSSALPSTQITFFSVRLLCVTSPSGLPLSQVSKQSKSFR
jgi:hypothetical protein